VPSNPTNNNHQETADDPFKSSSQQNTNILELDDQSEDNSIVYDNSK
jgi:hypothetical protein